MTDTGLIIFCSLHKKSLYIKVALRCKLDSGLLAYFFVLMRGSDVMVDLVLEQLALSSCYG